MNYILDVYKNGEMQGTKEFACPSTPLNKWVKREANTVDCVPLSSALELDKSNKARLDKQPYKALGYLSSVANDIQNNNLSFILSSARGSGNGWSITKENFEQSMLCLIPRKLTQPTWLNNRDEYSVPDLEHPDFNQFKYDAIVWALFNGSNQYSSIKATYKDRDWDIKNEFFWMDRSSFTEIDGMPMPIVTQADKSSDRFIASWVTANKEKLSEDVKLLLEHADNMIKTSAWARANADPKFQLMRWDAGWYQIRMGLFGDDVKFEKTPEMIEAFKKFQELYKTITARLRPMVYELGYLPKEVVGLINE